VTRDFAAGFVFPREKSDISIVVRGREGYTFFLLPVFFEPALTFLHCLSVFFFTLTAEQINILISIFFSCRSFGRIDRKFS
jgi:hypothetical protein